MPEAWALFWKTAASPATIFDVWLMVLTLAPFAPALLFRSRRCDCPLCKRDTNA